MSYINKNWATFGVIMALTIITIIFCFGDKLQNIQKLACINLVTLLLHQFEEYSYPGKFKFFYNTHILNKNPITKFPLTDNGILVVNIFLAWTMYSIAVFLGTSSLWLNIGLIGVTILNGIMHSIMFLKLKRYNPGLITGSVILIPFGLYFLYYIKDFATFLDIFFGVIIFVIGTVLIPLSIFLTSNSRQ